MAGQHPNICETMNNETKAKSQWKKKKSLSRFQIKHFNNNNNNQNGCSLPIVVFCVSAFFVLFRVIFLSFFLKKNKKTKQTKQNPPKKNYSSSYYYLFSPGWGRAIGRTSWTNSTRKLGNLTKNSVIVHFGVEVEEEGFFFVLCLFFFDSMWKMCLAALSLSLSLVNWNQRLRMSMILLISKASG